VVAREMLLFQQQHPQVRRVFSDQRGDDCG
jgi:hypothetical protein